MDKAFLTQLRINHFIQEIMVAPIVVPALSYFIFVCFPIMQEASLLFLFLVNVSLFISISFGYWVKFLYAKHIVKVVTTGKNENISLNILVEAKHQAYNLPTISAALYLFRWTIIGNISGLIPFAIIKGISPGEYFYISLLLLFAGVSSMPYVFLSTERSVSEFLRFKEIRETEMNLQRVMKLTLTPKIILLMLTILVPPLGFLLTVISVSLTYNIPLASIKFGYFLVVVQAIFYSILTSIMFARNIKSAIEEIVHILKDMSQREGDLTKNINSASNDEVGALAYWFNRFTQNLRGIIKSIVENASTLDLSSNELSKYSSQMSKGADDMSQQSNMVASSAEEMNTSIASVAVFMSQATANVNLVASAIEEMTASINNIAQNSEEARNVAGTAVSYTQNASGKVDELGVAAQDISKITEVISEISEQTNLLALNATIEAARAGEAGKGFAVVAAEIKELARQTAEATQEIKARISGIQNSTTGTVSEIKKISEIINEVNDIVENIASAVEEQAITTKEIADNIAQASAGNQETSRKVDEIAKVSDRIAEDISAVYRSANGISGDSSEVSRSAEELSRLAEELKFMVDKFKI